MRRVVSVVAVCLASQLILPPPAHAWFGWWDELSGAGPFRGLEIEARVACFGEVRSHPGKDGTLALIQRQFDYETGVYRADPKAAPDMVRRLADFNALLSAAVSSAVTVSQLEGVVKAATAIPRDGVDARLGAALTNVVRDLTDALQQLRDLRAQRASAGVVFSACPIGRDNNRRISINATFRLLHTYGERKAQYAGGNEIKLAMFVPAVAWRPLADFPSIDIVDLAAGGGVYWFSSEGGRPGAFEPFNGIVLEPVRIDLHLPTVIAEEGWGGAILAGLSYRRGWAIFPAGFKTNAFGATSNPEQAQQIPGEWVRNAAIFWDFAPLIHYARTRNR